MNKPLPFEKTSFIGAFGSEKAFPKVQENLSEVAFVGRSNVGKSSLINCLTKQKNLAKTSSIPGKTTQIVFFNVESQLRLIDLPGYGYAKANLRQRAYWAKLIESCLTQRSSLKLILHLIDSRHGPTALDLDFYEWAAKLGLSVAIVLTKSDKLKQSQKKKQIQKTLEALGNNSLPHVLFSTQDPQSRKQLIEMISQSL